MEEHLESHDKANLGTPEVVAVGGDNTAQVQMTSATGKDVITWEASDHINYDNGKGWVALMIIGGLIMAAGMFFLVNVFSSVVVVILMVGMIFYSKLKPQSVRYTISDKGISVGGSSYSYSDFRSFSFSADGGVASIFLVPMQRFMIPVTMYISTDSEQKIVSLLAEHLPNEQRKLDFMDKLAAKLRL